MAKQAKQRGPLARWTRRCAWGLGGLCGLYAFYWIAIALVVAFLLPGMMNREVSGNRLAVEGASVGGFPFNFDMRFNGLQLAAAKAGLEWQPPAGALDVKVPAYAPWSFDMDLSGPHSIAPLGRQALASEVLVEQGHLKSSLSLGRIPNAVDFQVANVSGDLAGMLALELDSANFFLTRPGERTLISGDAEKLRIPAEVGVEILTQIQQRWLQKQVNPVKVRDQAQAVIGDYLNTAVLAAHALPPLPADPNQASMRAWQQEGGRFVIEDLRLELDNLILEVSGSLGLTPDLRPDGDLEIRAVNLDLFMEKMFEAEVLPKSMKRIMDFTVIRRLDSNELGQRYRGLTLGFSPSGVSVAGITLRPNKPLF